MAGRAEFNKQQGRRTQHVRIAYRQLPLLFQVTEEWNSKPKIIRGNFITTNALRVYVANTMLGWSQNVCSDVFGTARPSVARHIRRVEDSRDEAWFDDVLCVIEEHVNSIQKAITPREEEHALQRSVRNGKRASIDESNLD